jgi:hypothetical protein
MPFYSLIKIIDCLITQIANSNTPGLTPHILVVFGCI